MLTVRIKVYDRPGLLYEITHLMQQEKVNITYVNTPPAPKGEMHLVFTLEIVSARQFVRILHRAKALVNVIAVHTLESHLTPEQQIPATSLYRPE
jgi:(p)ppGpp synthase/HD superfamily hydrolase